MTKEESLITRRGFVCGFGAAGAVGALGVAAVSAGSSVALADGQDGAEAPASVGGVQYGFAVDADKCVGCKKCINACREENGLPDTYADRRWTCAVKNKRNETCTITTSCMHCENASCVAVCPAGALKKGEAGLVTVDKTRCIGCKYCYQACPFGVPQYNADGMDKCDGCVSTGVTPGEDPNCVKACLFGALTYGPIDQLRAKASDRATEFEAPTKPSCILIA